MMLRFFGIAVCCLTLLTGCLETQSSKGHKSDHQSREYKPPHAQIEIDSNTVFSIFQSALPPKELPLKLKSAKLKELSQAESALKEHPDQEQKVIAVGQTLFDLGLYFESIKTYSDGLEKHPTSYELHLLRGESYIVLRQFDLAIEDLQKAAFYSRPTISDANNKSALRSKFDIYYNLGITYYLKGNFDKAISSFKICLTYCSNNDLLIRASDWFYLTYRKIGNEDAAKDLLLGLNRKIRVESSVDYLNRVMVYKEVFNPETVLTYAESKDNSLAPVLSYGIACWYAFQGNKERSAQILERILLNKSWYTLEYIAAEVDLKRLQGEL